MRHHFLTESLSILILAIPFSMSVYGCDLYGVEPAKTITIKSTQQHILQLNGAGTRTKMVWGVYVTALYLSEKSRSVDHILTMPGYKRLWIHFLRDVNAEKLKQGWQEGFELNSSPDQLERLQQRLEFSYTQFTDVQSGDTVFFDYDPDKGSQVIINGKPGTLIPGEDFFRAVLKIWIGDHPAQHHLKNCLLDDKPAQRLSSVGME